MKRISFVLFFLLTMALSSAQEETTLVTDEYYTYHQASGNRYVSGTGGFPENVEQIDLPLEGAPLWVVGAAPESPVPTWGVLLEDGSAHGTFALEGEAMSLSPLMSDFLPAGMPPVLKVNEIATFIEETLPEDASPLTHPVRAGDGILYIAQNGDIVAQNNAGEETARLSENALPDARIALNADGQAAVYVGATDERYVHAIMGDALEAAGMIVLDTTDLSVMSRVELEGDAVFEGQMPLWADVDENGTADLVTTASFSGGGAQIRVYTRDGALLASGQPIGQGGRWRHQLAWGPFGPNGENELVEVLTPHIGGVVGFYQYDRDGNLLLVAQEPGYTSHVIESRNLDMAIAGDFDGDGQPEVVLPNQARTRIAGLAHTADGIQAVWTLPLDGVLVTNLSAVTLPDDRLALAAGVETEDGYMLRVWLP